ncbi:hypothetical protein N6G03_12935 [Cupriavidus gilardii]|nr:hypothetical protein [Cupriavidus gilardii]
MHSSYLRQSDVPLYRRGRRHDATTWYPEIAAAVGNLKAGCIFDGEVCVLDEHRCSDFELLHRRSARRGKPPGSHHVAYCVFDLLVNGGRDIRGQPIEKRKAALGISSTAARTPCSSSAGWKTTTGSTSRRPR